MYDRDSDTWSTWQSAFRYAFHAARVSRRRFRVRRAEPGRWVVMLCE